MNLASNGYISGSPASRSTERASLISRFSISDKSEMSSSAESRSLSGTLPVPILPAKECDRQHLVKCPRVATPNDSRCGLLPANQIEDFALETVKSRACCLHSRGSCGPCGSGSS
jgi:hypothetical protein